MQILYFEDINPVKKQIRRGIKSKLTRKEFSSAYTDYEYIYLTVLGFALLDLISDEFVRINNKMFYRFNPAVQRLEQVCGMTMHGDRPAAEYVVGETNWVASPIRT